jgi:hypothetical protein
LRSMQRLDVADDLQDLRVAQLHPRWHSLSPIPIHQQPVKVANGGVLLHASAAQRGVLLVAVGFVSVAMSAMVYEYATSSRDRIRLFRIRIRALTITCRNVFEPTPIGGCEQGQARTDYQKRQEPNRN